MTSVNRFAIKLQKGGYEHTFLSNGFIEPDGSFVEREYQAYAKTKDSEKRKWIMAAEHPFGPDGAKKRGRNVPIRPDHEEVKFQVMSYFVAKKFHQWPELAQQLRDTGSGLLVEGNDWHDNIWGDCFCGSPKCSAPGRNWLGLVLMTVRECLRWGSSKDDT